MCSGCPDGFVTERFANDYCNAASVSMLSVVSVYGVVWYEKLGRKFEVRFSDARNTDLLFLEKVLEFEEFASC